MKIESVKHIPAVPKFEKMVLGSLIMDTRAADVIMPIVKDHLAFNDQRNQFIFLAVQEMFAAAEKIDLLTVIQKLKQLKRIDDVGESYLIELSMMVGSTAHLEHHCRILMQYYFKRMIILFNAKISRLAMDESQDTFELIGRWQKEFDKIGDLTRSGRPTATLEAALKDLAASVEVLSNRTDHEVLTGVDTGFYQINRKTGGYKKQELVVVAARPGMGKTSYVLKMAVENLRADVPVGFISLEMSVAQLTARMVAIDTDFHLKQLLKSGFDKLQYFDQYSRHQARMEKYPFYMDDSGQGDVNEIVLTAKAWKRMHGIQLLVIDYLQLMGDRSLHGNRENEVANISRRLKLLAKELDIPVVVLSQLSRQVENRGGDRRPRLSDLRDSGAIEQDADIVQFIYRPEYYQMDMVAGNYPDQYSQTLVNNGANTEILWQKNRSGSLNTYLLKWVGDKTKFVDVADPDAHFEQTPDNDVPY